MEKYICIHGHFYQPPRENPWLEGVELQDSAYPNHDWNEKITEQCYRPNTTSRILGEKRKIVDIVNNYTKMSFDFGPTLLYWLEKQAPETYRKIIEADKLSREQFSGHGCAMAQSYNHMIMPLANSRDRLTQIVWGIRDFEYRFERKPEGMWLPETAVDLETLEIMSQHGISFTVLAPHQAAKFRKKGARKWTDTSKEGINPRRPYICELPSGSNISIFFYDGPTSHDIAYGGLLHSGENFASRLLGAFEENGEKNALVHIATDGESYGHHHRHGDMALAYCVNHIESKGLAKITVYGEYLEKYPPGYEVQIHENTSWSCAHGIERWRSDCGCRANREANTGQQWRGPLREAMDLLRDKLAGLYESKMSEHVADCWKLRNDYIAIINNRDESNIESILSEAAGKEIDPGLRVYLLKLLEMQRNAMLMYTSCGWFFDNISGIETMQIMQYASRAIQLAREVDSVVLEDDFKGILEKAPAHYAGCENGKEVYEKFVAPSNIDLNRVGAHFAISSLFMDEPERARIFCYSAEAENYERVEAGAQRLAVGSAAIKSEVLTEEYNVDFAVIHFGEQNIIGGVGAKMAGDDYRQMEQNFKEAFGRSDTTELIRLMNLHFGRNNYSLWHLFRDEQRKILYELLETTWEEIEASFRHIYEHNYSIIKMMRGMNMPLPKALSTPAEFILNQDLCRLLEQEQTNIDKLTGLIDEVQKLDLDLDRATLSFEINRKIEKLVKQVQANPEDLQNIIQMHQTVANLKKVVQEFDLQQAQNAFLDIYKTKFAEMSGRARDGDENAGRWIEQMSQLAEQLGVKVRDNS